MLYVQTKFFRSFTYSCSFSYDLTQFTPHQHILFDYSNSSIYSVILIEKKHVQISTRTERILTINAYKLKSRTMSLCIRNRPDAPPH